MTSMLSRRSSLLALTLGTSAVAAGVASKRAMAECHNSTLPALCGIDIEELRELHREQIQRIEVLLESQKHSALSREGLKAALDHLYEINSDFISREETDSIKSWIDILYDKIDSGLNHVYEMIESLIHEAADALGDVARTIASIFLDTLNKTVEIAESLSDDQVVKVVSHDLRGAIDGLDISTHIIRRYKLPVHPAALVFSAIVGGASGSIIGYFDYARTVESA